MPPPAAYRVASMLPAVLLTMLFYLDQNISVRAVNACNLKKVREADTESWIDVLHCVVLCCIALYCVVLCRWTD
jgi:hypothetical protein